LCSLLSHLSEIINNIFLLYDFAIEIMCHHIHVIFINDILI
jgi:hypothetical protein